MSVTVDVEFKAKLDGLLHELEKMPEVSSKEAKQAVKSMERQWKRANRIAARAARKQVKSTDKIRAGLQSVKEAAEGFGGQIGGAVGMVEKFGRASLEAGGAFGPLVAIVGGVTLLFGGAAFAIGLASQKLIELMQSAVAAAERLDGPLASGTEDAAAALATLGAQFAVGSTAADRMRVVIGGELAPAIGQLTEVFVGASLELDRLMGFMAAGHEATSALRRITLDMANVLSLGVVGAIEETVVALGEQGREYTAVAAAQAKGAAALEELGKQAAAAETKRAAASKEAATAEKERFREAVAFRLELSRLSGQMAEADRAAAADYKEAWAAAQDAVLGGVEEIKRALQELLGDVVGPLVSGIVDAAGAASDAIGSSIITLADLRNDALIEGVQASEDAMRRRQDAERERGEEEIDALLDAGQISEAEAARRIAEIDASQKAERARFREQKRQAQELLERNFRAQKKAARGMAIVDAARAAISLIPAYSILGTFAPAAAAATAALALGTQLAVINAQEAPEFPRGGLVSDRFGGSADHVTIGAQLGEGVLTRRGVDAVGGRAGLEALNAGAPAGPTTIRLEVGATTIAAAVLRSPGVLERITDEIRARLQLTVGQSPVYGRG